MLGIEPQFPGVSLWRFSYGDSESRSEGHLQVSIAALSHLIDTGPFEVHIATPSRSTRQQMLTAPSMIITSGSSRYERVEHEMPPNKAMPRTQD